MLTICLPRNAYREQRSARREIDGMAKFWRYVRIQLFVLVCDIVGPIFLPFTLPRNQNQA